MLRRYKFRANGHEGRGLLLALSNSSSASHDSRGTRKISPGTHWIASSMRRIETAASYADLRLFTLLIVGSRTPAETLSRTSPFRRSRP